MSERLSREERIQRWRESDAFHPVRGYTRRHPEYEKDNWMALRNGMHSPRVYGSVAEEVRDEVLAAISDEGIDYMARPTFRYALEALITTIARVRVGRRHVAEAHDTGECERESCLNQLDRLEREHDRRLDAMGLTARSRAKIEQALSSAARDQADIRSLMERGREIRQARERLSEAWDREEKREAGR